MLQKRAATSYDWPWLCKEALSIIALYANKTLQKASREEKRMKRFDFGLRYAHWKIQWYEEIKK